MVSFTGEWHKYDDMIYPCPPDTPIYKQVWNFVTRSGGQIEPNQKADFEYCLKLHLPKWHGFLTDVISDSSQECVTASEAMNHFFTMTASFFGAWFEEQGIYSYKDRRYSVDLYEVG